MALGGSTGSGGGRSVIEWMLSIGGTGVDASGASAGDLGVSSAILFVGIGTILECSLVIIVFRWKGSGYSHGRIASASGVTCLTRRACRSLEMHDALTLILLVGLSMSPGESENLLSSIGKIVFT